MLYALLADGDRFAREDRLLADCWMYQQDSAAARTSKETKDILNAFMPDRWTTDWQQTP